MLTEKIAKFITQTQYGQIAEDAVKLAKKAILDCIGNCLAGSLTPEGNIILEYTEESGGKTESTVIGGGFKSSALHAALANGTMASVPNCSDTSITWNIGHPSETILPTILALGEKLQVSGKELIVAYIIGFEVGSKIGSGMVRHYELGWHTTATVGTMAATAAAAKVLNLDLYQIQMALGIAGSEVSGLQQNRRTMTRALHSGLAARNGVMAACLAKKGLRANAAIFEGPIGLTNLTGGDESDLERAVEELGNSFDIIAPGGLCLKCYPSCYMTQTCISIILNLINEHYIQAKDVTKVTCRMPRVLAETIPVSLPKTGHEGKGSVQYCMATALLDGEVTSKQFTDDKVRRPEAQELCGLVKYIYPEGDMTIGEAFKQPQAVTVWLNSGEEYTCEKSFAKGDIRAPMTEDECASKFCEYSGQVLTHEATKRVIDMVWKLDNSQVSDLTALLVPRAGLRKGR